MNSGLDPELLVIANGHAVPASKFLPPPMLMGRGFMNHISYDNAAAELRPAHTSRPLRLVQRLRNLLLNTAKYLRYGEMRGWVPAGSRLTLAPSAVLKGKNRKLKSCNTFGCSPSQVLGNDYGVSVSVPIIAATKTPIRSAGFHIHQELRHSTVQHSVAVLDGLLGLTDVIVNHQLGFVEESRARRLTLGYGRAGEFRTRHALSGTTILEYRTLSPWPFLSPAAVLHVVSLSQLVCRQTPEFLLSVLEKFPTRSAITRTINKCDVKQATKLRAACHAAWTTCYEETHGTPQETRIEVLQPSRWAGIRSGDQEAASGNGSQSESAAFRFLANASSGPIVVPRQSLWLSTWSR